MKVAILGLGLDTQDIIPYLENRGDKVTILDEKKGDKFDHLDKFDLIIRSPGVYRYRPEILAAEKAGVTISSKTKLFFDLCPAPIIGVTGTKGKGTTATLIYQMLEKAHKDVYLGGNIGKNVFHLLPKLTANSWVVLELSSFQLIDLDKSPHIAVVLMVTSEHLDWHPTTAQYLASKANIVKYQGPSDFALVNKDYPHSVAIGEKTTGKIAWVSGQDVAGWDIALRGPHNQENVAAAAAVARLVGVPDQTITKVAATFKGLEHRLEEVASVGNVFFYNDSFSTTPETAIAAIKSFSEPLILIAGGSEKGSDFTQLGKTIAKAGNVKAVILIGLMADRIAKAIPPSFGGEVLRGGKSMAEIVNLAYNKAVSGDVILLSPACASFDMFRNYKERGEQFKTAVRSLR